ncbi:S53 family peptidase [Thermogemmatispora sp.]|uniref:S53 family peptidase n=1 Tax=Thermogemmatispora sp. TaxID=1968838 RepID=UPI001DCA1E2C|nr:S53 family peptidase [Thermogemmatispora sp.]MBX5449935.1 S8/S53 family peptidase [Thermogemmatispora sp.]
MPEIPDGFTRLTGSERHLPAQARRIRSADPNERIEVSIYLRDPAGETLASELERQTNQPGPQMSRNEYMARHSASAEDVERVEAFAQAHQLQVLAVDRAARRLVLGGTVAQFCAAFATELHQYEYEGETFRGRSGYLHVPRELEQVIVGVFGLDDRPQAQPHLRFAPTPGTGALVSTSTVSYTPLEVAQLYDFPRDLTGSGQCIALIELGGGYSGQDLAAYFQQLGLKTPEVVSVSVDGGENRPTGDPNSADGEVALDIEIAGAVAPGARIAVYFAPNTDRGFLDAITQAIHDTTNAPSVISISWGAPEASWTRQAMTAMNQAFQAAASLGITVCVASGDNGASDGLQDHKAHVDFPASSPYVLGCGGTRLETSAGQVTREVAWNETAEGGGATGGGISDVFPLPPWQQEVSVPPSINDQHQGRGVPDVAGNADPQTGYQILVDGQSTSVGGTSAVAPLWAGLIALLNQRRGQPVGYLNPFLYQHYRQLLQQKALRDVTSGDNGGYAAGPGWDACTGLGTPDGALLVQALLTSSSA